MENDKPADEILTDLLHDALLSAKSHQQKESVRFVINQILDQDMDSSSPPSQTIPLGVSYSSDFDYIYALHNHLEVTTWRSSACKIADAEERQYQVNPSDNVGLPMKHPMPRNEEWRIQLVKESGIRKGGANDELNIICNLAAKGLGCFCSFVTIVDETELYIAASSLEEARHQVLPRDTTMCTYTIMGDNPMVVPHPEADIRFHRTIAVGDFGARFYCGFPLLGEDKKQLSVRSAA